MTLTEMRRALETADDDEPDEENPQRPRSRLPPQDRGVGQSRSCLVEVDLPGGKGKAKKGTLTFANTVSSLKRAGSSRDGTSGLQRSAPRRAQSCMNG